MKLRVVCNKVNISFVTVLMLSLVLLSCSKKNVSSPVLSASTTTSSATTTAAIVTTTNMSAITNAVVFTDFKTISAKLHALVTFSVNNNNVNYPTDFAVPQVTVNWTGLNFQGKLTESGPGEDITDEISGTISTDGNTLLILNYSRLILRADNTGTSFNIAAANVPLTDQGASGAFNYSGSAIQKYVSAISYADGPVVSGQITPTTSYVSTDWNNTQQSPSFALTFLK